ncbi:hypothetical protein Bca52824_014944 [Brassica carinata]|uniref:Uncharacterized protein n=1 Tax=Brassica carinata TaxID=52824 RepID=A0A8X7W2B9_BRACI|nr:hypothetical protein Bca52824_014944 [Brassica carinata]
MNLQDKVRDMSQNAWEKAAHDSRNAWERVQTAAREHESTTEKASSPTKVAPVATVVGMTAIAAAFGTCMCVGDVCFELRAVLGRQQFGGGVQSKLYISCLLQSNFCRNLGEFAWSRA